jgi:hypothetical protein
MNVVANIKFVYKLLAMMIHVQNSWFNEQSNKQSNTY